MQPHRANEGGRLPTITVGAFEDSFVIHFGTELPRINAYTLATTLVNLADAAKAANAAINPGYEIEVVVEALGAGSFRAKIRAVHRSLENLFSKEAFHAIVLSVIANFVYQHTLAPHDRLSVNVGTTEVVIEHGDTKIIVPREIHEATQKVELSPRFRNGMAQAVRAVEEDKSIASLGFSADINDPRPQVEIPRDDLARIPSFLDGTSGDDTRELIETTHVEILRAILERSKRRWEFVWNGMKISAPVTDEKFYTEFFAHRITIAPGDALLVRLRIRQKRAAAAGVFINESFEVVEVLSHIPRPPQLFLTDGASAAPSSPRRTRTRARRRYK